MPSGCLVDAFALIIYIVVVYVSLHEFDGVATLAPDYPVLLVKKLKGQLGLQIFVKFGS